MTNAVQAGGTLYPLDDLPEAENGLSFGRRLKAVEQLSPAQLEQLQDLHLRHLLTHHTHHTPQWRQRLAAAGLPSESLTRVRALRQLPPLRRTDIQQAGPGLFSTLVPFDHLPIHTSQTSGSSGEPVRIRRSRINGLLNEAASLRDHRWWSRPANGGRLTMFRPLHDGQREQLADLVREALGHPFEISVQECGEPLPVGPNGKFEEFACRLACTTEVRP